ncbi:MAG: hypothetical protein NVS9B10_17720 [Nevskia sp.]
MTKTPTMKAVLAATVLAFSAGASAETFTKTGFYSLDVAGWKHQPTPNGEVFACNDCGSPVQVQIDYGAVLPADSEYKTNAEFLGRLNTEETQREFASLLIGSEIPAEAGLESSIEKVSLGKIGGLDGFQYSALISTAPKATRENAVVAVHKHRIMKLTLNYFDEAKSEKADAQVAALFKSLKFF